MEDKYVVRLLSKVDESRLTAVTQQVSGILHIDSTKLSMLLSKGPTVLTRAISQLQAEQLKRVLSEVGLQVDTLKVTAEPATTSASRAAQLEAEPVKDTPQPFEVKPIPSLQESRRGAQPGSKVPAKSRRFWGLGIGFLVVLVLALGFLLPGPRQQVFSWLGVGQFEPSYEAGQNAFLAEDYKEAIRQWQPLAEAGDVRSQYQLAALWRDGNTGVQDLEAAARLFRLAAEQGSADAQFELAALYFGGDGLVQSDEEAARWFERAAVQGMPDAQLELAAMYYKGLGVEQNFAEATKWYTGGAERGDLAAQFYSGVMYYEGGFGLERDDEQALFWFEKVEAQDSDAAKEYLDILRDTDLVVNILPSAPVTNAATNDSEEPRSAEQAMDIFTATREGNQEDVLASLFSGQDVNAVDAYGQTPLMYAAGNNTANIINDLISAGAAVNAQSGAGWTALMYAARDNSNIGTLQALLDNNADVLLRNSDGQTALDVALQSNPLAAEMIRAFIDNP